MLLYYKSTGKYKIHMDAIITNAEPSHWNYVRMLTEQLSG
jgi:hypothetical protein